MNPIRKLKINVNKHSIIDEKKPFILYLCEIKSQFSKKTIRVKFENFLKLQKELEKLSN